MPFLPLAFYSTTGWGRREALQWKFTATSNLNHTHTKAFSFLFSNFLLFSIEYLEKLQMTEHCHGLSVFPIANLLDSRGAFIVPDTCTQTLGPHWHALWSGPQLHSTLNSGTFRKEAVPSLRPSSETQMESTVLGFTCVHFPTKWVSRICSSYTTYPLSWSNRFFFAFPPVQTPPLCFLLLYFWMFKISRVAESCWVWMDLGEVL